MMKDTAPGLCEGSKDSRDPTAPARVPRGTSLWAIALLSFLLIVGPPAAISVAQDQNKKPARIEDHMSAIVFIYHRFGEAQYPSTNTRIEQFEAQIAELKSGGYSFVPLPEIVSAIRNNRPLPDRTVAITIDDGYLSAYTEAWPRLKAAGIPLTVFIATDPINAGARAYMNWEQVRQLARDGVTIGHHGASHHHMLEAGIDGSLADIARASSRFETELGFVPDIFAYPFGEHDTATAAALEAAGFKAAFAQFSSVARVGGDAFALPRFPINERYSDLSRYRLIANARALPTADTIPANAVLSAEQNPPIYGFSLTESVRGLAALACYPSHLGKAADIKILGERRVEVRFDKPFPPGRNRINCTMPGPNGRWYWLGRFFFVPEED